MHLFYHLLWIPMTLAEAEDILDAQKATELPHLPEKYPT